MSGCNRWAHVWIHVWSRSRPASQGGRQSWAGRGGRWLWQDLEGNFPESQGQEHLELRCSDWPANRPSGPRSARCWRSRLEHRRYIAYCPRTETADWSSASPRYHWAKSVRGVGTIKATNIHQVWRQKVTSKMPLFACKGKYCESFACKRTQCHCKAYLSRDL